MKMSDEIESMKYYMAAEKMTSLLNQLEQTFEFFDEFKIKPDDEVKKALIPMLLKMKEWIK